jgi:hypothetical protein
MIGSTLLTMVVVPTLYVLLQQIGARQTSRKFRSVAWGYGSQYRNHERHRALAPAFERVNPELTARAAQIIDATFSSPIRRASARTSRFWSSRSWNNSGIAADLSCWTSSASASIGAPFALGAVCRVA